METILLGIGTDLHTKVTDLYKKLRERNSQDDYPYDETDEHEQLTVDFEFETKDGVVLPFNEDSHYGTMILSDEESEGWVKMMMINGLIDSTDCGMLGIYEDKIEIQKTTKRGVFNFHEDGTITKV
jgi:hypothetical protein